SHCSCFFPLPPPTEIDTLSLHDALPIFSSIRASSPSAVMTCARSCGAGRTTRLWPRRLQESGPCAPTAIRSFDRQKRRNYRRSRSEEHTSELQSRFDLVCRLLLEKKK